jgi:hypothetical protein
MTSIPKPEYHSGPGSEAKVVDRAAKLDTYMVEYKDGEGKKQVRLAFVVPGSKTTFIVNSSIAGKAVVTTANPWFHKALSDLLEEDGTGGAESI